MEVAANQLQILDRAPNSGISAKAANSSKPVGPVDEGDNPVDEQGSETTDQAMPFSNCPDTSNPLLLAGCVDPPDGLIGKSCDVPHVHP